eukprot:jgi/Tetstr1/422624/TSEL_013430.t1
MDIWWASRSTFGRPFTPPARPSRRPVGLEVRFDKMHAYIADMEAARREHMADIEWRELDGHYGIPVLNAPLGSPGYVQAYMRGKAEELREEVDASLSKLLFAKPSRRLSPYLAEAASTQLLPRRYDHFLNDARGSAGYAAAVREAWDRLHAATACHLSEDADARVIELKAKAASGLQNELTVFLD